MSKVKHKSLKSLRKRAWKLISEYVRRSNADEKGLNSCFTCGIKKHWKEMDCSHYIHKDCLDYDLVNLHACCSRCNRFLHGNLGVYAERLIAEYGGEAIAELRERSKRIKKFTVTELEEIINLYTQRLKELDNG